MIVNKITILIVMLIAVIIFCVLSLFYMKVSCTGMYESYIDPTRTVDPVLNDNDLPNRYKNISCIRMTPQEFWVKLTITPELKKMIIDEFKNQKDSRYDNFSAVENATKITGVIGVNKYTLINWAAGSN
jgi:hypothetical protein